MNQVRSEPQQKPDQTACQDRTTITNDALDRCRVRVIFWQSKIISIASGAFVVASGSRNRQERPDAAAISPPETDPAGGWEESHSNSPLIYRLNRLPVAGAVLHLGAHPDDEDSGM